MFQGEVNAVSGADADLRSGDVQAAGLQLRFPLEGLERRDAGVLALPSAVQPLMLGTWDIESS